MRFLHVGLLFRLVPLVAGAWLGASRGIGPATAIVAGAGAVATLLGVALLHTSPPGTLSWRNIVAGWLMPWGFAAGSDTLAGIALTAFTGWAVLGAAGAFGWATPWLLAAWLLDAFVLAWITGPMWRRSHGRVQKRFAVNLIAIVVLLAAGGFVAALLGAPLVGAAIAGGPLAVVGVAYGIFVGVFVVVKPRF